MKKTIRRLLPLMLMLSLAVCLLCVNAFAANTGVEDDALPIEILEPEIPTTDDGEIVEIPDEAVPIADLPADAARQVTGDMATLWLVVGGISCAVLVAVLATSRKRSEN